MTKLVVKGEVQPGTKQLVFHPELCVGCHLCTYSCGLGKFGSLSKKKSAIRIVRVEFDTHPTTPARGQTLPAEGPGFEYPHFCIQCKDKPCMTSCPTDALVWDSKLGIVDLVEEACIGCGLCAKACPYDAIAYADHEVVKCDLCHGNPVCTTYCPTQAIEYKTLDANGIVEREALLTSLKPHAHPRFEVGKEQLMREGKKEPPARPEAARQLPPGMDNKFWQKVKAGDAQLPADFPKAAKVPGS